MTRREKGLTWNLPPLTSLKERMAAPSSARVWLIGGMLPGVMPPTSCKHQLLISSMKIFAQKKTMVSQMPRAATQMLFPEMPPLLTTGYANISLHRVRSRYDVFPCRQCTGMTIAASWHRRNIVAGQVRAIPGGALWRPQRRRSCPG